VRRYARRWQREHLAITAEAMFLCPLPRGSVPIDWSHEIVVLKGVATTVKVAHVRSATAG